MGGLFKSFFDGAMQQHEFLEPLKDGDNGGKNNAILQPILEPESDIILTPSMSRVETGNDAQSRDAIRLGR